MAKMPRIVTLNNLSLNTGANGVLSLDAIAKTFRYLDQDELDAQAKARKAKKAKGGADKEKA
jgi:type IV pilus assembly protein PilO